MASFTTTPMGATIIDGTMGEILANVARSGDLVIVDLETETIHTPAEIAAQCVNSLDVHAVFARYQDGRGSIEIARDGMLRSKWHVTRI